ncbi:MAG: SpoIIE family protein phosphatase [Bacteroides sp.]|nr:SpoIIE family protein phosphatase [Bacteroides sp.]
MEKELFSKPNYFKYPLIIFCGFGFALASLMEKISPFGIALIGSMKGADCLAAFVGAALGYLMKGDFVMAVPPIAAGAAVCVLKIFSGRIKGIGGRLVSGALTGAAVLLINIVTAAEASDILLAFAFGLIAAITSYTFSDIRERLKKGERLMSGKPLSLLPAGVSLLFMVAALSDLSFGIFNFGSIASGIIALTAVYRFRLSGGAALGIICAMGMAIGSGTLIYASLALSAGALAAAVIAHKGRIPMASAFLLACAVGGGVLGMDRTMLSFIANMLTSSVIFMALPLNHIMEKVKPGAGGFSEGLAAEVLAGRLELVGNTVGELRYAVEKTAEALEGAADSDLSNVYNYACDKVCKSCRFNMKCWGEEYNDSARIMNGFIRALRCGDRVTPNHFGGALSERCQRKQQLCDAVNKRYDDVVAIGQMNRRIKEMRNVLTKQLDNTERLFGSIAEEFGKEVVYNPEESVKVGRLLERCGLSSPKAAVKTIDGNMTIEAYGGGELACTAEELGDMLIEMLQREFDLPCILEFGKKVRITAFQRAEYGIKSASCQYSRRKGSANGDFVTACVDGKGKYYSIVSDGMGSGTRARIDSAFACGLLTKFLESGVGAEAAIEMLNTALMVKSSDESFATLDVCMIDLYTGKTTLYKAGGADTFVRSGKKVTKIKGSGLPVGVSGTLSLFSQSFSAEEDDVIIMTTDGADLSEQWLEQAFLRESGGNMEELVKTVAGAARFNCEKGREDDISIVALQLKK